MTSRRRRRASSVITRFVLPALFVACLGGFAVGRLVPGRPSPAPAATAAFATPSPQAATVPPSPSDLPSATQTGQAPASQTALVSRVIDGDTIEVLLAGQAARLRYIGIDSPERGEPCAAEATAANEALVAGQTVALVKDVSETDRFGRLLRYVYVGDTFVNAELVAQGYARSVAYPPDTAQQETFAALEAQARALGLGCHALEAFGALGGAGGGAPAATQPAVLDGQAGPCDPAYPTVCIPPPPPDLDCADISHRRFEVLPLDPHRFDGDGNGIGCER